MSRGFVTHALELIGTASIAVFWTNYFWMRLHAREIAKWRRLARELDPQWRELDHERAKRRVWEAAEIAASGVTNPPESRRRRVWQRIQRSLRSESTESPCDVCGAAPDQGCDPGLHG